MPIKYIRQLLPLFLNRRVYATLSLIIIHANVYRSLYRLLRGASYMGCRLRAWYQQCRFCLELARAFPG